MKNVSGSFQEGEVIQSVDTNKESYIIYEPHEYSGLDALATRQDSDKIEHGEIAIWNSSMKRLDFVPAETFLPNTYLSSTDPETDGEPVKDGDIWIVP